MRSRLLPLFLLCATPGLAAQDLDARLGAALFDKHWVPAPASTRASDGLGPLYNARSCASCHAGAGRGRPDGPARVARVADPVYGRQLQDRAIPGHLPEARMAIRWEDVDGLRRPVPAPVLLKGPLSGPISLRLAPPLAGLGALDSVPEAAILARADPEDRDGDGISGRPNWIDGRIGRFGAKAASPDLPDFIATAFATDIGIGSPLRPGGAGDCPDCTGAPDGRSPAQDGEEIGAEGIRLVAAYLRARPARPKTGPGAEVFAAAGCPACHVPALAGAPAFTDLLLHDMGAGLADGLAEGEAAGAEWRTAPLLDLTPPYLHDGRAATIPEAVAWHGGEGAAARSAFATLSEADRDTLIHYLEGQ